MTKIPKRKYEKIDDAEIDLVLQCNDSHEFYERYREVFPTRKKGIESISKIWKRRNEFQKKKQVPDQTHEPGLPDAHELEDLLRTQNRILVEMSAVVNEQLMVCKSILNHFQNIDRFPHVHSGKSEEPKVADKNPVKKIAVEKPSDIMIGS